MNENLDRDSICWSITDGCTSTYLYPEDVDYLCDGLKLLRERYNELGARLVRAGMPNSSNRIRLRISNIGNLITLLGGSNDNTLTDSTL